MTEILDKELTPEELAEREAWNSPEAVYERELAEVERLRNAAYSHRDTGSDVLVIKATLGEDGVTIDDAKARKAEIRAMYPKPEPPVSK